MATTTNGIYYPNDYESVADIPTDMKKLAESVDTKISENKTEIEKIKKEQTTQSTNISNLQKDNTTNKQDITNIKAKDTEQDKYIAELEAENARLREDLNGLPKGQASGESIDLSDSAEMRCDLKISGNSKQETSTQGKNLLTLRENEYTAQGANVTLNKNQLIIDGTVTSSGNLLEQYGDISSYIYLGKFPSGTYRFSKFIISGSYTKNTDVGVGSFACYIRTSDKTSLGNIGGTASSREGVTITLAEDTDLYIQIYCNAGAVFNNYVLGFQLEEGDTTTELEDFIPNSPSPDYPSEIECCGDNINFFDKDNANILDGCYINESKKIISSNAQSKTLYIEIQPNTTYTIHKVLSSRFAVGTFVDTPAVNVPLTNFLQDNSKTKITITSGENDNYLAVFYYHSNYDTTITPQEILNSIKIENGQGYINEVICNKNLVNVGENSYSTMGLNITLDKSRIKINGTPTSNNYFFKKDDINAIYLGKFKKGTYYMTRQQFSGFTKKGNGFSVQIRKDVWNGTAVASYGMGTTLQQKKVILDEDVDLYLTMWANKDDIYNNVEFLFSIYSDTDINHVQHQSQSYTIPTQQSIRSIEIAKNTFLRDTFIKKNNKWYERHYISRKIFDGTESINTNEFGTNSFAFTLTNIKIKDDEKLSISNYFKGVKEKDRANSGNNIIYSANPNYIIIRNTNFANLADFKSWLTTQYNAGTPVYVDYVLETPVDIKCTEEQSTILFDIEQNAKTYDKVTHMYSTDNVSSYKDVTYKKDLDTMITNIEQAILSQGGNI